MKEDLFIIGWLLLVVSIFVGTMTLAILSAHKESIREMKRLTNGRDLTFDEFGRAWLAFIYPNTLYKTGITSKAELFEIYVKWQAYKRIDHNHQPKVYFKPKSPEDFK